MYSRKTEMSSEEMKLAIAIGQRITQTRILRGMFQNELARQMNCSRQYLSKLEQGKVLPSLQLLLRVSAVLRCNLIVTMIPTERA